MKQTIAQSDYRRASADMSRRTFSQIKKGPPKRNSVPYQPGFSSVKPVIRESTMPNHRELELAKEQARKFLAGNAEVCQPEGAIKS